MQKGFEYRTIGKRAEGIYKEKGSRFIGIALPVSDEDGIHEYISMIRKEHYNARHHCYAYRIGKNDPRYRYNDDGEPSGTAGKPIYGQILSNDLSEILILVVRYFGGVKLGTSGLIRAYRSAAAEAITNAEIITQRIEEAYTIRFNYARMNQIMRILKDEDIKIHHQHFGETYSIGILLWKKQEDTIIKKIGAAGGEITKDYTLTN
ncbi:MAG: YigZ family protein [Bacteroidales bacterium]|nr:YigZ family protein [Bacteroidales bacterium]